MTDGFAAVVTLKVKPDDLERFTARLAEIGGAMSQEKEFKHAWVHALADDPTTIVIYEAWSCDVDYFMDNLFTKPYRHDYEAELTDMLREDRRIEIVNYVQCYPGRS